MSNNYPVIPEEYNAYIARALATDGGHLSIGRGGFVLYFGRGARLSGYDYEAIKDAVRVRLRLNTEHGESHHAE